MIISLLHFYFRTESRLQGKKISFTTSLLMLSSSKRRKSSDDSTPDEPVESKKKVKDSPKSCISSHKRRFLQPSEAQETIDCLSPDLLNTCLNSSDLIFFESPEAALPNDGRLGLLEQTRALNKTTLIPTKVAYLPKAPRHWRYDFFCLFL